MKLCGFIHVAFFVLLIYLIFSYIYSDIKLPLAPVNYCPENNKTETCQPLIQMSVNSLASDGSAIQYDYNYFDFCQVRNNDIESETKIFGSTITGESASPYYFTFLKNETREVCGKVYSNSEADKIKIEKLQKAIRENYKHHWTVDKMPITWCYIADRMQVLCHPGLFPIGCYINDDGKGRDGCHVLISNPERNKYYIFNHIEIVLDFHPMRSNSNWGSEVPNQAGRLVKARMLPKSVKYTEDQIERAIKGLNPIIPVSMKVEEGASIIYSFRIYFSQNTHLKWSDRWDYILDSYPNTRWFGHTVSFAIFMLFFGMVTIIILINLRRDINHYNQTENLEEEEERGWKMISSEVFRPPMNRMLLSLLLGNGVYIFLIVLLTLYFAWLGFFSPENTSSPEIYALVLLPYLCLTAFGGYVSSRIYKTVDGQKWKTKTLVISLLCPWIVLGVFVTMKQCVMGLSYSTPFSTLATSLAVCLTISVFLNVFGMYFGFKTPTIVHPVSSDARAIPIQPFYTKAILGIVIGGIVPFGCTVMNLAAIFNRIWSHQLYSVFGTLFIMFLVLVLSCSLSTIILCYLHLRAEDYHWWWRSFLTSGFSAVYFFLYSVYYYVSALKSSGFINALFYFGYTTIITIFLFLFTGTIGFFACFWFIRKIYGVINVDKQRIWNIKEALPKDEAAVHSNSVYHKLSEVLQRAFTYVSKRTESEKPINQEEYKLISSLEDNDR